MSSERQKKIFQNKIDKGFNVTNVEQEFCLMYGEVGEAYEAFIKKRDNFGEELADVAIYLYGLAEMNGVDLDTEIERKMKINEARKYHKVDGVLVKENEHD